MVASALKYAKAWAVVAMASRLLLAAALMVPAGGLVAAGGGEIAITVKLGDA